MSKKGLNRNAASAALNSNEENAASAARFGAQFDAADAARYAAHRPAGLSLSQYMAQKRTAQNSRFAFARNAQTAHRIKKSAEKKNKMATVTNRAAYKRNGKLGRGERKNAELKAEAEHHHAFPYILNAPNARRRSLNQYDSNNNNVLFNMPPPAKMHLTRVNSAEKADSPLSPRAFRSNMLFATPPVKRASAKYSPRFDSPRSNSSERAQVRLSPSAFKSKKARKPSPKKTYKNPRSKL